LRENANAMKHNKLQYLVLGFSFLLLLNLSFQSVAAQQVDNSPWHITATDTSNYVGITLANGRIGLLPSKKPFTVSSIILNNVYDKGSAQGVSRVLRGINFANIDISVDGVKVDETNISDWKQVLNLKEASLTTTFDFRKKAKIAYTIYALRGMPYAGIMEVSIKSLKDITVNVTGKILTPAEDKDPVNTFKILKDLDNRMPLLQTTARSPFGKQLLASTASFIFKGKHPELHHKLISRLQKEKATILDGQEPFAPPRISMIH